MAARLGTFFAFDVPAQDTVIKENSAEVAAEFMFTRAAQLFYVVAYPTGRLLRQDWRRACRRSKFRCAYFFCPEIPSTHCGFIRESVPPRFLQFCECLILRVNRPLILASPLDDGIDCFLQQFRKPSHVFSFFCSGSLPSESYRRKTTKSERGDARFAQSEPAEGSHPDGGYPARRVTRCFVIS